MGFNSHIDYYDFIIASNVKSRENAVSSTSILTPNMLNFVEIPCISKWLAASRPRSIRWRQPPKKMKQSACQLFAAGISQGMAVT